MLSYLAELELRHWLYFFGVVFPWIFGAIFAWAMIHGGSKLGAGDIMTTRHLHAVPDVD